MTKRHSLVLCCVDCGDSVAVEWAEKKMSLDDVMRCLMKQDWLMSLVTPPEQPDAKLAPLCPECAKRVYPASMRATAKWNVAMNVPEEK